jgi:tetratricopeptide (TPR) repeat protein
MFEEAIMTSRQLGSQANEVEALLTSGTLTYWRGDYEEAIALYEEAIGISEKIGDRYQNLWGDIEQASAMFQVSIRDMQKAALMIALVFAVEGLASLYANQNQPERAIYLFAWADAMRNKIGDQRPPVEQNSIDRDLVVIHSRLDDEEFASLVAKGSAMTVEQAIALALDN